MILEYAKPEEERAEWLNIFDSCISDQRSDFKTVLCESIYLRCSYKEGSQ